MLTQMTARPLAGEPLVPPYLHALASRLEAFAQAIGIKTGIADIRFRGCLLAPCSGFALIGTSCARPLLLPEGRLVGEETDLDVIVLRHDADRGSSFDLLLGGQQHWLLGYAAWRRQDGDLWLVPTVGEDRYFRVSTMGLEPTTAAPFHHADERRLGIIRAIEAPSFEGSL